MHTLFTQVKWLFLHFQGNQHIRLEVFEKVVTDEKGEGHYKINSYKYKADYGSDLKLNLTNLFRGSPEISKFILMPTLLS